MLIWRRGRDIWYVPCQSDNFELTWNVSGALQSGWAGPHVVACVAFDTQMFSESAVYAFTFSWNTTFALCVMCALTFPTIQVKIALF